MSEQTSIAHNLNEKVRTKDVVLEDNVNFDSLLLPEKILKGLEASGFRKPSPIQFKSIPIGRCGFDLVVKSKSGTGKTLVFSVIALEAVNPTKPDLQALILVPTREIAVQIKEVLNTIGGFIEGLKVESFIGGLPIEDDIKKAKGCHIAVGAPGRVKHLISQGALPIASVRLLVLDEADKLMETSFQGDINEMFHLLPAQKQIIASSATYPQQLDVFLARYMLSPTHVTTEFETPILLGLKQFVSVINVSPNVVVIMKAKNEALVTILAKIPFTQCLIFSNYQTRAESVSNILNQKGWNSTFVSAAQSQSKRLEAINSFKQFKHRILLSTDLTSRGIDAANVDLVINYDIPHDAVTYLHRMGRAGRYGSSGICINLALQGAELAQLQNIIGTIGSTKLSISKLPDLNDQLGVWDVDSTTFEQIYGTVSTDGAASKVIKTEILQLKQKREKKKEKVEKTNKSKAKVASLEEVSNLLSENKKELDGVSDKFSGVDTESLLQSLVAGNTDSVATENGKAAIEVPNSETSNLIQYLCDDGKLRFTCQSVEDENNEQNGDVEDLLRSLAFPDSNPKPATKIINELVEKSDKVTSQFRGSDPNNLQNFGGIKACTSVDGVEEEPKKRKRSDNPCESCIDVSQEYCPEKRLYKVHPKLSTFCKNKALLSVTSLLCSDAEVDSDPVDSVRDYLALLKTDDAVAQLIEERKINDATVEEPLSVEHLWSHQPEVENGCSGKCGSIYDGALPSSSQISSSKHFSKSDIKLSDCLKEFSKDNENERPPSSLEAIAASSVGSSEVLQDIFKIAYDYAIDPRKKHWLDSLPEIEQDNFEIYQQLETRSEVEDPDEDYEMEDESPVELNVTNNSNVATKEETVATTNEHFTQCYQECSDQLWQNGLRFERVEDFDNWYYYQWQEQLQSVRSYVQQNIYVKEMGRYQQRRPRL